MIVWDLDTETQRYITRELCRIMGGKPVIPGIVNLRYHATFPQHSQALGDIIWGIWYEEPPGMSSGRTGITYHNRERMFEVIPIEGDSKFTSNVDEALNWMEQILYPNR